MTFNYRINSTVLVNAARAKRVIIPEITSGVRAAALPIAFRDGAYVSQEHSTDTKVVPMLVDLAGDTPAALYDSYHNLMELIYGGTKTLQKLDPQAGEVEADIFVGEETAHGSGALRQRLTYPIMFTRGYWQLAAADSEVDTGFGTSDSIGPFTPGGSHRTYPKFTITCTADGANPAILEPVSGAKLTMSSAFVNTDVIVIDVLDRVNGGVTLNGVRAKNLLDVNRGYWMRFLANVAHTLTWTATSGTWDVTTEWKDSYR